MEEKKDHNRLTTVTFSAVLSGCMSSCILIFCKVILGETVQTSELLFFVAVFGFVVFLLSWASLRKLGWPIAKKIFYEEISAISLAKENEEIFNHDELDANLGIKKIHSGMNKCIQPICENLSTSKEISIYVQIGRDLLSGRGVFFDHLRKNKVASSVRILHASKNNPYLSEDRAKNRVPGKYSEWHIDLASIEKSGKSVSSLFPAGTMETRPHNEGFTWRIFVFDSVCFVQPYIYERNNAERAPVIEIERSKSSLYTTFRSMFDQKWEEYTPKHKITNDILREAFPISVTAHARVGKLNVFVVPARYCKKNSLQIQAPGGKVNENEEKVDGLKREILEELGCESNVQHASYSTYFNQGADVNSYQLQDSPAPLCIYRRDVDEEVRDSSVEYILVYSVELLVSDVSQLSSVEEGTAVLCLSNEALNRVVSTDEHFSVEDMIRMNDGSCLITESPVKRNAKITARGMVPIISTLVHSR